MSPREMAMAARVERLERRVQDLESKITKIMSSEIVAVVPEDCRLKRCSYYQHYLAYGPAELEHEGYHAAEQKCIEAQRRVMDWYAGHEEGTPPVGMQQIAEDWERRVRA